jgi:hypothetical protein
VWIPGLSLVAQSPDRTLTGYSLLTHCHVGGRPALALAARAVLPCCMVIVLALYEKRRQ